MDYLRAEHVGEGCNLHLEYYDDDVLSGIICRSASILDVPCSTRAASEIASRSRGTPRIANALLRRVRDFAQVKGSGSIDTEIANFALEALNIDKYGLDEIDNKILCTIIDKFKGGPVGAIFRSAAALGIDAVLLTPTSCDPLNRRAVRVSMGSVFLVPWTWLDAPIGRLNDLGFRTAAMQSVILMSTVQMLYLPD